MDRFSRNDGAQIVVPQGQHDYSDWHGRVVRILGYDKYSESYFVIGLNSDYEISIPANWLKPHRDDVDNADRVISAMIRDKMPSTLVQSSYPALVVAMANWPAWTFVAEPDDTIRGWIVRTSY